MIRHQSQIVAVGELRGAPKKLIRGLSPELNPKNANVSTRSAAVATNDREQNELRFKAAACGGLPVHAVMQRPRAIRWSERFGLRLQTWDEWVASGGRFHLSTRRDGLICINGSSCTPSLHELAT